MIRRIVLFDVDGTLLHPYGAGSRALETAFARVYGLAGAARDLAPAGRTDLDLFPGAARRLGVPWEPERVLPAYLDALAGELARGPARLLGGVAELCAALRARGDVALGLQTGNVRAAAEMKLAFCGLGGAFGFGGFGEDGTDRADVVRAAVTRAPAAAPVVVVGDAPQDVAAGRAVGARTVAVATGFAPLEAVRAAGPDVLLPDLADLTAALAALGLSEGRGRG